MLNPEQVNSLQVQLTELSPCSLIEETPRASNAISPLCVVTTEWDVGRCDLAIDGRGELVFNPEPLTAIQVVAWPALEGYLLELRKQGAFSDYLPAMPNE